MINAMGCTITVVYNQNLERYFLGSNSDNPWDAKTKVCVKKGDSHKFIGTELVCDDEHLPWSNMITRGVNEKGIAYTFAYVDCSDIAKQSEKIRFKGFGEYLLGNFSSLESIQQYIKEANELPHGNFLFADSEGNSLVCELHPEQQQFEWNPKTPFIKTNHYLELKYFEEDYVTETNSLLRYQGGREEIDETNFETSIISGLTRFLSNHRNEKLNKSWGSSTCNHGSSAGTVSSEIIDTKNRTLWYCYGPPCGRNDKLNSWGEYIKFSLSDFPEEGDLTTTSGQILNNGV